MKEKEVVSKIPLTKCLALICLDKDGKTETKEFTFPGRIASERKLMKSVNQQIIDLSTPFYRCVKILKVEFVSEVYRMKVAEFIQYAKKEEHVKEQPI